MPGLNLGLTVHHWTYHPKGGAGIAARRLHSALCAEGVASRLHCAVGEEAKVEPVLGLQAQALVQSGLIAPGRPGSGQTRFSLPIGGLAAQASLCLPGLHHLHWVNDLLGLSDLEVLVRGRRPVVWTLHDHWPMTGGCHYHGGCRGFEGDCAGCPQLDPSRRHWPIKLMQAKRAVMSASRLVAICPSEWMACDVRRSALWREARIEVIPNAIDTDVFSPGAKAEARRELGIPAEARVLLFVADQHAERRKGVDLLQEVLPELSRRFSGMVLLMLGGKEGRKTVNGCTMIGLGRREREEDLAACYCASDLVVVPSREDNLPNILLEAAACGVASVGFSVGGIAEVIGDRETGLIAGEPSVRNLEAALSYALADPNMLRAWGEAARARAIAHYSAGPVARRHAGLYQELHAMGRLRNRRVIAFDWPDVDLVAEAAETQEGRLQRDLAESEADRAARLVVIERQAESMEAAAKRCVDLQESLAVAEGRLSETAAIEGALLRMEGELRPLLDERDRFQEEIEENRRQKAILVAKLGHLEESVEILRSQRAEIDADRAQRLELIDRLSADLLAVNADHAERGKLIERLSEKLAASEDDRLGRMQVIERQASELEALRADHAERGRLIEWLSAELAAIEADRVSRLEVIGRQESELDALRAGHAERGELIERLNAELAAIEADRVSRLEVIGRQASELESLRVGHAERGGLIERQASEFETLRADHAERGRLIEQLSAELAAIEADREDRLAVIERQALELDTLRAGHAERGELIDRLSADLSAVEADRGRRLEVIERQASANSELRVSHDERGELIRRQAMELDILRADHAKRGELIKRLSGDLAVSEADRRCRLEVIERQASELDTLRSGHAERGELIKRQAAEIAGLGLELSSRRDHAEQLEARLWRSESDRKDQLETGRRLRCEIDALHAGLAERAARLAEMDGMNQALRADLDALHDKVSRLESFAAVVSMQRRRLLVGAVLRHFLPPPPPV